MVFLFAWRIDKEVVDIFKFNFVINVRLSPQ